MFRAASETSTSVRNSPHYSDRTNSSFNARFGMPVFKYYQQNPLKGARFAKAMTGVSTGVGNPDARAGDVARLLEQIRLTTVT